jgi:hypothetical protein
MASRKKNTQTRIYNRWEGYYIEDLACEFCLYFRNRKFGCVLDVCCCLEEKADALKHGRIKRKPGSLRWDR